MQAGVLVHKKNSQVKPHVHIASNTKTKLAQEVLYIKKGKVRVFLYDEKEKYLTSKILNPGDAIALAGFAHGIKVLKKSVIMEIKQGPFLGISDKKYIKVQNDKCK